MSVPADLWRAIGIATTTIVFSPWSALTASIGVSRFSVRRERFPSGQLVEEEPFLIGGQIGRFDLRPDIFVLGSINMAVGICSSDHGLDQSGFERLAIGAGPNAGVKLMS